MAGTSRTRAGILAVALGLVLAGGVVLRLEDQPQKEQFCKASLPIREIDGRTVAIQDRDPDGEDCDLDQTMPGMATLGIDCKVRAPDGTVLQTLRSSRPDGTCGIGSPAP